MSDNNLSAPNPYGSGNSTNTSSIGVTTAVVPDPYSSSTSTNTSSIGVTTAAVPDPYSSGSSASVPKSSIDSNTTAPDPYVSKISTLIESNTITANSSYSANLLSQPVGVAPDNVFSSNPLPNANNPIQTYVDGSTDPAIPVSAGPDLYTQDFAQIPAIYSKANVYVTQVQENITQQTTVIQGGSDYSNANVAAFLATYNGNISADYFLGNGSQLTGISGGSGGNTGNVTFSNQIVIGTGDSGGYGGLYLAPGNTEQLANNGYFRVRGGDVATHLHFDTGNNQYYDQFFGDDSKHVQLASTGNIVIRTDDYNGNTSHWTFDTIGSLTVPANIVAPTGNTRLDLVNNGTDTAYLTTTNNDSTALYMTAEYAELYANTNVSITANISGTPKGWSFGADGNMSFPTGATIADISGFGPGLSTIVGDANGITLGTGPGNDITFTPADGAAIYANGFMWTFSVDGTLTTPGDSGNITGANVISANTFLGTGNLKLQPDPNTGGAYLDVYLTTGPDIHIAGNGENLILGRDTGANIVVGVDGNVTLQADSGTPQIWTFDNSGNLTTPGNIKVVGNTGNLVLGQATATGSPGLSSTSSVTLTANRDGTAKSMTYSTSGDLSGISNLSVTSNITASGNFDIDGNASIGGNLFVTGNINFSGNVTQISGNSGVFYGNSSTGVGALYAGKTGYTALPNTVVQMTGDDNAYIQINLQNTNHGNTASMELAITADDGSDVANYIDLGMASSNWDGTQDNSLGTAVAARDGYLYVQGGSTGGNLVLGTTTAGYSVKFNAGGPGSANTVAQVSNIGITTTGIVSATGNVRGANLNTVGQVSATGNVTGNYILGNVAFATGMPATYGNSNVTTLLAAYGSNSISTSGNITGAYLFGNGSQLTGLASSYGDSNVNTLLAAWGSNTISTTGNITSGNVNTGGLVSATGNIQAGNVRTAGQVSATGNVYAGSSGATGFILGNVNSKIGIIGSNATITMSQNIAINPDQAGSPNAGLQVGGGGYILAANGARVLALGTDGSLTITTNLSLPNGGNIVASTGNLSVGGNITRSGSITANSWGSAGVGLKLSPATYTDNSTVAGTLAAQYIHSMGAPTFVFSNAVTVTNAATLYVNSPTAGANATLTNAWAIYTNGNIGTATLSATGNVTGGNVNTGGAISASGNVTVSGTGGVSIPNLPAFRVYGSGVTAISTTTNTTGIINGNNWTVDYNQGSYLNSTTGVFTAPVAGLYQINLVARVANNTAATAQAIIYKNYGSSNAVQTMWESAANPTINHFGVSTVSKLAAGDTLTFKVTVGTMAFDGNDNWSVAFLG